MVGTARDLNRFFAALASGRLLKPAELAAMRTTVPVPQDSGHPQRTRAGLGLFFTPLSCGGGYLGHGGSGFGYAIRAAATADGRRTITVSAQPLRGPGDRGPSGGRTARPDRPRPVPHQLNTHSAPR
ncbi:beta-lactamase family protein [Streptomyces sp. CWNU-1]|uniref:Beta-lactamase family protein n=2 Tax=Streptomyces albipurpureus TaxID=2897419 RepID=A0ABT0UG06_9ACTN|nr:beta-lactamase family protein [Streptomyces sp. CWNU-1]MCM2387348.1 beta-lactamase family protein [Streptomyces sp. CWNU-1]